MQLRVPVLPLIALIAELIKDAPGGISPDEWSAIGAKALVVVEAAMGLGDVVGPVIDAGAAAAHVDKVLAKHGASMPAAHANVLADLAAVFRKAA